MKKKILCAFLAVFIICIAAAFILLQPYLKTAIGLGKVLNADSLEFHAEVRLNPDALSENEMTAKVYCNAVECPLTEINYGENKKTINIKMFYEAIEESLPDKLWLLKTLMPEWNLEEETVTFEQLKALGIDMEALIPLENVRNSETPSTMQYLYMLSRLEKEKDENGDIWFRVNYENYFLRFCVKENEDGTVILLEGEAMEEEQKAGSFEADITAVL